MPHRHESLGLRQQTSARSQMQREYCAEVAQADGEPMAGTADVVDVWIMLEYLPAWTAKATTDNALATPTKAWLKQLADQVTARGLKAAAAADPPSRTRSHRCDADAGHAARTASRWRLRTTTRSLRCRSKRSRPRRSKPLRSISCAPTANATCAARVSGCRRTPRCANGLADRAWQTTHVGGHRFAPNVLTLPQAALYGRVQPADVGEFVDAVDRRSHCREVVARTHTPFTGSAGGRSCARNAGHRYVG